MNRLQLSLSRRGWNSEKLDPLWWLAWCRICSYEMWQHRLSCLQIWRGLGAVRYIVRWTKEVGGQCIAWMQCLRSCLVAGFAFELRLLQQKSIRCYEIAGCILVLEWIQWSCCSPWIIGGWSSPDSHPVLLGPPLFQLSGWCTLNSSKFCPAASLSCRWQVELDWQIAQACLLRWRLSRGRPRSRRSISAASAA